MANKQNLGKDLTLSFAVAGSIILDLGLYTDVSFKPLWSDKKIVPINNGGIPIARSIYQGHDVEIIFGRRDSVGEQLGQFLEDNYCTGGVEPDVILTQIIRNDDGGYDTWQYINGIVYPTDDGSFKTIDEVNQTFKFFFSRKQLVSLDAAAFTSSGANPVTVGGG